MIKKLTKHGNSYALIIDKAIQELMGITRDSDLELEVRSGTLSIKRHQSAPSESRFDRLLQKHISRYRKAFEELAK